jgi:hypothetical protein
MVGLVRDQIHPEAQMTTLTAERLDATWNGHDWTGPGSIVLNQCPKEVGWMVLPWPQRAIFGKMPPHVHIELEPVTREQMEGSCKHDNIYVRPVQRFRILGLKLWDKVQGTIYSEQ